jgi:choline dehydrogenase-like flavoprotein
MDGWSGVGLPARLLALRRGRLHAPGRDCRSHHVPNLWICDGSVLPTGGAVNPSLTIQAIATRTARLALAGADEQRRAA